MSAVFLPAIPIEETASLVLPSEIEPTFEQALVVWLDAPNWKRRFALTEMFLRTLEIETSRHEQIELESAARLFTAMLEQLGERDITCIEAAACYRVSQHTSWRKAAGYWLSLRPESEFALWSNRHPAWAAFSVSVQSFYPSRPE